MKTVNMNEILAIANVIKHDALNRALLAVVDAVMDDRIVKEATKPSEQAKAARKEAKQSMLDALKLAAVEAHNAGIPGRDASAALRAYYDQQSIPKGTAKNHGHLLAWAANGLGNAITVDALLSDSFKFPQWQDAAASEEKRAFSALLDAVKDAVKGEEGDREFSAPELRELSDALVTAIRMTREAFAEQDSDEAAPAPRLVANG